MARFLNHLALIGLCAAFLAACAPAYSPNTYSSNAVQLANKVDAGVIVGYREVSISANGSVGAVTGGAAGGVLGGEYGNSALAAIGGTTVGAMVGTALEHAAGDTTGWEYIIRKLNGDMLSVTQREKKPLELGQKVLVINGPQARVVPDYATASEQPPPAPAPKEKAEGKPESNVKVEVVLSLPPGASAQSSNGQVVIASPSSNPAQPPSVASAAAQAGGDPGPIPASVPSVLPAAAESQAAPPLTQHVVTNTADGADDKPAEKSATAAP